MMTRYGIVAAALTLMASATSAQQHALDRGSIQVAGSASLVSSETDDDDDRTTTIGLNPQLRYFVAPRLAIGADLTIAYAKEGDFSSRALGIGPAVTYYFAGASSTVHPYLSANVTFASLNFKAPGFDRDGSQRSARAAGGILTLLSSAVGITTELFYQVEKNEFDQPLGSIESKSNSFGLAVGIAAFVF